MIYSTFGAIFWTHFFIGVVIGVVLWLIAIVLERARWFQFGGRALGLGLTHRWMGWLLFCYALEFLTSCGAGQVYQEMAYTIVEGPIMALGVFVVDRIARWYEFEQPYRAMEERLQKVASVVRERRRRRPPPAPEAGPTVRPPPPEPDHTKERFDDLTRDK